MVEPCLVTVHRLEEVTAEVDVEEAAVTSAKERTCPGAFPTGTAIGLEELGRDCRSAPLPEEEEVQISADKAGAVVREPPDVAEVIAAEDSVRTATALRLTSEMAVGTDVAPAGAKHQSK